MRDDRRLYENAAQKRMIEGLRSSAAEMDRKYWIALALFAILALLVWFTMGEDKILVAGKPVELRWLPLIILGGLALRTVLARQAERIRRQDGDEGGNSGLKG
jgi:cytochrome bd-type quinol oxidase subunit 2